MIKSTGALLLFAVLSTGQVMASDMAFGGSLLGRPCHVPSDSLDKHIVPKTHASRDFWYPPGRSPTEPFIIRLENCHATAVGKAVTLTFKGTGETTPPGHLKITRASVDRLSITLLDIDGSSLLKPGASCNKGRGEEATGNSPEFPFGVYVVATPEALRTKSVVPGDYEATATFELTYR